MFVNMDVASHNHRDAGDAPGGLSAVLTLLPKGSDPTVQLHQLTGVRFEGTSENGISIALPAGSLLLEAAAHFDHQVSQHQAHMKPTVFNISSPLQTDN